MFLEDVFLEKTKSDLERIAVGWPLSLLNRSFDWDPYVAKSLLQKSIRRGEIRQALNAASFLCRVNELGFWKRLRVIALEDIGVANTPLVAQVLIAEKDRPLRRRLGGSARVGEALVAELCASSKDRSTDDLIDVLNSPKLACIKAEIAEMSEQQRLDVIVSRTSDISKRAIAAELSTASRTPATRAKEWSRLLELIPEDVLSPCTKIISQIGLQRTKSEMALLLALLVRDRPASLSTVDDPFPPSVDLAGLPSWALDGHTRLGLEAFRLYIKRSPHMASFLANWSTGSVSPAKVVGGLVFRTESHLLTKRLNWETGERLVEGACSIRPGLPADASQEGLSIIQRELELVNDCRAKVARIGKAGSEQ